MKERRQNLHNKLFWWAFACIFVAGLGHISVRYIVDVYQGIPLTFDRLTFGVSVIILFAYALAIALFARWATMRHASKPLTQLTGAVQNLSEDNWSTPLPMGTSVEIERLSTSFGVTRDRIKTLIEELKQSEAFSVNLVEMAEVAVVIARTDKILYANPKSCELFGRTHADLMQLEFASVLNPSDASLIANRMQRRIEGQEEANHYEAQIKRKSGEWRNVLVNAALINYEGEPADLVWLHDITTMKQTQDALRQSESIFRNIITRTDTGYVVADHQGRILNANEAYVALTGHNNFEEIEGQLIFNFVDPAYLDSANNRLDALLKDGVLEGETRYLQPSGEKVYVSINAAVENATNDEIRIVAICRNITARKEAEQQVQKNHEQLEEIVFERTKELVYAKESAELANQAKSEFLANMSHELRTPMHAILSFSNFGVKKLETVPLEKLGTYFDRIRSSGDRLLTLLDDLLDLAKLESGKMAFDFTESSLLAIVDDCIKEQESRAQEAGVALTLQYPDQSTMGVFDGARIGQVVTNLISNALKFSKIGSSCAISIAQDQLSDAKNPSGAHSIPALRLSVRDQGIGVPADELVSVFDKFVQSSKTKTGAGGTGLGLAICQEIIESHGGRIWVENAPDGGAIFSFIIPQNAMAHGHDHGDHRNIHS